MPETRFIGSDELLTELWLRVAYENQETRRKGIARSHVTEIASLLEESEYFDGFVEGSGVAEAWLRADLLKALKRQPDQFVVARPMHLPATRLRNTKKASDANASSILYGWLCSDDHALLADLKSWIDIGNASANDLGDLPAYALARLAEDEEGDIPTGKPRSHMAAELCPRQGRLFCQDMKSILAYRGSLPRAVLIDHVRRLATLHLALHTIRTMRAVVEISRDPDVDPCCDETTAHCEWTSALVADCGEDATSDAARLAERSWGNIERLLSSYVRAHLRLKKLEEFAREATGHKSYDTESLRGISRIATMAPRIELDAWAQARIASISSTDPDVRDLAEQYRALDMEPFDVYMSLLYADAERRWFGYHRQVLDSVFAKNERDGAMRQPLGGRRRRRIALSPPLIETLVLVAMVDFDELSNPRTRSLRVDQLVDRFDDRYGLLVARPASADVDDPLATRTMVANHATFRKRLRQAGLFVDQSDAFLAQTIRPRVRLG